MCGNQEPRRGFPFINGGPGFNLSSLLLFARSMNERSEVHRDQLTAFNSPFASLIASREEKIGLISLFVSYRNARKAREFDTARPINLPPPSGGFLFARNFGTIQTWR
jgi:hypothetical protein